MFSPLKRSLIVLILAFVAHDGLSGTPDIDSLKSRYMNEDLPPKSRADALSGLIWTHYLFNQPDTAFQLAERLYEMGEEHDLHTALANARNIQGISYAIRGDYDNAIKYYTLALQIIQDNGDYAAASALLNNIANIHKEQGNYAMAIKSYSKAIKLDEKLGEPERIANSYNNIGLVYAEQGDLQEALSYYNMAESLFDSIGHDKGLGMVHNNMGNVFKDQDQLAIAGGHYRRALHFKKKANDAKGLGYAYYNLGDLKLNLGKLDSAIYFFKESIEIRRESQHQIALANSLTGIAKAYLHLNDYNKAIKYADEAYSIGIQLNTHPNIKNAAFVLYRAYKAIGRDSDALEMHEAYLSSRDTIMREENRKAVLQSKYKLQYERKAAADSIKNLEQQKVQQALLAAERAEKRRKQFENYFLYGGMAIALVLLLFILNRFRTTSKQKKIIEEQKSKVDQAFGKLETKNTEILDSINYAKRLQSAILPSFESVERIFPESFVLYKPKDIVAGDFYWMESLAATNNYSSQKRRSASGVEGDALSRVEGDALSGVEGWTYIAAADCTGHGVPGAMVSVVCSNALTKALIEEGITHTGKLLDRTRELVIERFGKSEDEIHDGMDISLAAVRNDGKQVRWSGANNPLWVIKDTDYKTKADDNPDLQPDMSDRLHEVKADKQPIGKYTNERPFTEHTIDLNNGDTLYMFSDGFPDQFGGKKGKKYKTGRFKKLLMSLQDKSMKEQSKLLDKEFENWRGSIDQIDDVCVIGLRL